MRGGLSGGGLVGVVVGGGAFGFQGADFKIDAKAEAWVLGHDGRRSGEVWGDHEPVAADDFGGLTEWSVGDHTVLGDDGGGGG